jgi:hypothetical protein
MNVITPRILCNDFNDGLPILIREDWDVEGCWVIYRPLGLIFEIALLDCKRLSTKAKDFMACLTYQESLKPLPDMSIICKLGKKAIQVFIIRTFGMPFERTSFPPARKSSVEMPCDIDDDIPF